MQENTQTLNLNKPWKILRRSTHTFLTHLHHFTSTPTLLALPFSLSLLFHLHIPSTTTTLHRRLHSVLVAAGFPLTTPISNLILLKLSQTLSSSLSSLPLSFFLLLSKSSTIHTLKNLEKTRYSNHYSYTSQHKPLPPTSSISPLLLTHICNLFLLVAANSACITLLCLASTFATATSSDPIPTWVFTIATVFYSVVVAYSVVICNLALICSGLEGRGGIPAILRACALVNGKTVTALVLTLPTKLAVASVEAVFWFRIFGGAGERWVWAVAAEAVLIGYMYSAVFVWDTIVGCLFCRSLEEDVMEEEEYACDLDKLGALEEGN